ncbi:Protein fam86a [Massospora cicadina]|nr:Protein fam86a [Massospora cicadina]
MKPPKGWFGTVERFEEVGGGLGFKCDGDTWPAVQLGPAFGPLAEVAREAKPLSSSLTQSRNFWLKFEVAIHAELLQTATVIVAPLPSRVAKQCGGGLAVASVADLVPISPPFPEVPKTQPDPLGSLNSISIRFKRPRVGGSVDPASINREAAYEPRITLELVAGRTVLELGAGVGFLGVLASTLNPSRLTLTDSNASVLRRLALNVGLNAPLNPSVKVAVRRWDWAEVTEAMIADAEPNLVLGADVVSPQAYDPEGIDRLVDLLARFACQAQIGFTGGKMLVACTVRNSVTFSHLLTRLELSMGVIRGLEFIMLWEFGVPSVTLIKLNTIGVLSVTLIKLNTMQLFNSVIAMQVQEGMVSETGYVLALGRDAMPGLTYTTVDLSGERSVLVGCGRVARFYYEDTVSVVKLICIEPVQL